MQIGPVNYGYEADPITVEAFTAGDCWVLAREIHALTGWKIVTVGCTAQSDYLETKRDWCHMANLTPEGHVIDINGIMDADLCLDEWGQYMICCEIEAECATLVEVQNLDAYTYDQGRQYSEDAAESAKGLVDFYRSLFPAQNAAQIAA